MIFKLVIAIVVLVVGGLYIAYRVADRETKTAASFRASSGYETAALQHGTTAFRTYGPVGAPAIILVHGATLGSLTYQDYAAPLVAAGFRVVLYDQYGRGFSDRTDTPFSIDLMRAQLDGLMDHLDLGAVHLYGVSLGGAIVARFAAEHPERVITLGLQVPVIGGVNVSRSVMVARLPIIGPLLARLYAIPAIIQRGESFSPETETGQALMAHFKEQFAVMGTERMITQMITGDALSDRMDDHRTIAAAGVPAHFAYASDDPEIPATEVEAAIAVYNAADAHQFTGGHFFSYGKVDELAALYAAFIESQTR
tara:strand:- start:587 stop:1519 length:933 start_codon:yes stop_codon:yes gene_type:complete